jgi:hypothetical protein
MHQSIRTLQITAVGVVALAISLGGFCLFGAVTKSKGKSKPVATAQPGKYGRYVTAL